MGSSLKIYGTHYYSKNQQNVDNISFLMGCPLHTFLEYYLSLDRPSLFSHMILGDRLC
jgi:hypothetical protein